MQDQADIRVGGVCAERQYTAVGCVPSRKKSILPAVELRYPSDGVHCLALGLLSFPSIRAFSILWLASLSFMSLLMSMTVVHLASVSTGLPREVLANGPAGATAGQGQARGHAGQAARRRGQGEAAGPGRVRLRALRRGRGRGRCARWHPRATGGGA